MSETHSIRLNIDASAAKTGATQYVSAINKITKATEAYQSALTSIGKSKATGDFSRIATAMGKLNAAKVSPSLAKNINELSSALAGFRGPSKTAVRNAQSFFNMINAAQIRPGRASQIAALTGAMQGVRGPSRSSVGNITAFLNAINNMTVNHNQLANIAGLTSAFAGFKGPSKSAAANIDALVNSLNRLQVPKNIGNLTAPLQALAAVSASSARAVRQLASVQAGAANGFRSTGQAAVGLTGNMRGLENAMSLSYQAGSQLRVLFGSLTFAEFTRGVYNATLAVEKFNTTIGVTAKNQQEFQSQINFAEATADKFGISLSNVYDEYGKFATAARLAGQETENVQFIFENMSGAMRVFGTDAMGQQRVFRALTQMFSKGAVMAEELRQQLGEQLPAAFNLMEQAIEEQLGRDIDLNKLLELGQVDDSAVLLLANKMREVFGPHLAKALDRADAKIGRLSNSWFKFQEMIGNAGVMDAIGDVAQQLTDALESPNFKSNAQGIAEGIAKGIRLLGDAAVWATEHVRELGSIMLGFMSSTLIANVAKMGGALGSVVLGVVRGAGPLKLVSSLFLGLPAIIGAATAAATYYWDETVKIGEATTTVGTIVKQAFEDIQYTLTSAWNYVVDAFTGGTTTMDSAYSSAMSGVTNANTVASQQTKDVWDVAFDYIAMAALRLYSKLGASAQQIGSYTWGQIKRGFSNLNPFDDRSSDQIYTDFIVTQKKAFDEIDAEREKFMQHFEKKIEPAKGLEDWIKRANDVQALRDAQRKAAESAREEEQRSRAAQMADNLLGPKIDVSGVDPLRNQNKNAQAKDSVGKRAKEAAQALKDYSAEVADLNQMLQNGTITLEQFNQGLEYQARKLQESADPYAAMVRGMEDELKLSGVASKAREIEIAHRQKINELGEKGVQVTQEMSDKIRKLIEAQKKMDNQPLRDWVDGIEDVGVATDKVAVNAMEGLADQISELVVTGKADFASLAQSILKEFIKVGINQMYKQFFGGLGGKDVSTATQGQVSTPMKSLQDAQNLVIGTKSKDWELRGSAGMKGAAIPEWDAENARRANLEALNSSTMTLKGGFDVFAGTMDSTNAKITPLNTNLDTMTTSAINASNALNELAAKAGGTTVSYGTAAEGATSTGTTVTAYASPSSVAKAVEGATYSGVSDGFTKVVGAGKGFTDVQMPDGSVVRRTGDFGWRNNNPGNLEDGAFTRSQPGYLPGGGRFAAFSTLEQGRAAREKLMFESPSYKDLTLEQAITRYAPPHENDTSRYISELAKAGGVSAQTRMGSIGQEQRRAMMLRQEVVEGNRTGTQTVLQGGSKPISVAIDKVGSTGISNGNVFSKLMYSNQGATRSMKVDPALENKIQEAVGNVYGKDYTAQIYSGGQGAKGSGLARIGTTRHDDGNAADIYVTDPQGNRLRGDALAPLGQYWQAKGYGGTGMEMRGGGVHLDQHTDRARTWNYANQGGQFTNAQAQALQAGQRGIMPTLNGQQGIDTTATAGIQQVNDQLKQLGSTAQQTASVTQTYAAQEQATSQQNIQMQQQKMMADQQSGMAIMNAGSNASQASPQFQQAGQAIQQAGQQAAQGAQQALGQLGSLAGMIPGAGPYVGMASQILGLFEEGGLATKPVQTMSVPHYKEGTANTSGGMPAVLHPNEAVIPLSRGRKVPVELDSPRESDNTSDFSRARAGGPANITMVLNGVKDGDSFKRSKRQVETMYSSALRRQAERDT